jgi:tRNA A-37 threonylcarbamoyl transferase component Bud32
MTVSAKAGRYELIEEIGRGAMGVVYRASDPVIGRPVAVKTMRIANAGSGLSHDELLARFQTEARAAGRLTHPNIVVVYDAGEEDGLLYITMELVEGPSLQALIEAKQTFPLPRVLRLIEQACSALDFAHQHNIIHRDIKPANLMLTQDDTLKITDFGTAKILQFGAAQTAQIIGTPSYMSPEQIKGRPVDGRSDIFSLGVVLYELLTGQKPFPGDSVTTVIYKIVNENPVPAQELDSSIHPGLSAVIAKALAKPVEERFQTCREFIEALQNYDHYRGGSTEATMILPASAAPGAAAAPWSQNAARTQHSALSEAAPAKRRSSAWLVLLLLAVISAAGYKILPAVREIWQRSQADRDAVLALRPATLIEKSSPSSPSPAAPSEEPSPAASSVETPAFKSPETLGPSEAPKPTAGVASAPADKAVAIPPADVAQPAPSKPAAQPANTAAFVPEAAPPGSAAPKPYKPSRLPATPAAAAWQRRISGILAESDIADQVQVVATGNTLTLTGTLRLPQHRRLLARLRNIPDSIQIIDDIEYAEEPAAAANDAAPTDAPGSTSRTPAPGR